MQQKRRTRIILVLLLAVMLVMSSCETLIEILETPFPSAIYVADSQGIARIPYPEQQFTVRLSDPLLLMLPVERSGYYELVNLNHPQTLLYMSIFSMDADKKEPLADNVVGNNPTDRFNVQLEGGKSYLVGIGMLGANLTGLNVRFQLVTATGPKSVEPVLVKPAPVAVEKPQALTPPYVPPTKVEVPPVEAVKMPELEKVVPTSTPVDTSIPPAPLTPPEPDKAKLGGPVELKELPALEERDIIAFTDPAPETPKARVFAPFVDNTVIAEKNVLSRNIEGVLTRDGGPYLINGNVTIPAGKSLVIEEGTVIRVSNGASIQVQGTLETKGKAGNEVVFTGNKTNAAGSWAGIVFHSGSTAKLEGTRILGAGAQQVVNGAWRNGSIFALDGAKPTITDCEIANGSGPGITLMGSASPTITNSSFQNLETPLLLDGTKATLAEFSGNRFGTITRMGIEVNANVLKSGTEMTLQAQRLPYIFRDFTIEKGAKLTIYGYNVLKFHPGTGLTVEGTLDVSGSLSGGVYFTSFKDDRGYDSNADKDASKPQAGDWAGILFTGEGKGYLNRAQILYAGAQRVASGSWRSGALMVGGSADPFVEGCIIADSGYSAVTVFDSAKPTVRGSILRSAEWPVVVQSTESLGLTLELNSYQKMKYQGIKVDAKELKSGKSLTIKANHYIPYVMGNFTVEKGAKLNILGGTILKFTPGSFLTVRGDLIANTSIAEESIYFTSASSNHNGDSNGDGPSGKPKAGDWGGLVFAGEGTGEFNSVGIYYAGAQKVVNGAWREGAVTIADDAYVNFFFSSISHSQGSAFVFLDRGNLTSRQLDVTHTEWVGKSHSPFAIPSNMNIAYYDEDTVKYKAIKFEFRDIPGNSNATIDGEWLPGLVFVSNSLNIPYDSVLTFRHATVKFEAGSQVVVKGELNAFDDPGYISTIFTSIKDDIGNDTNGDGNQSKPAAGDWVGFAFIESANGTFEAERIEYAGAQGVVAGAWRNASIVMADNANLMIRRLEIKNSAGNGILALGRNTPSLGQEVKFTNIAGETYKR